MRILERIPAATRWRKYAVPGRFSSGLLQRTSGARAWRHWLIFGLLLVVAAPVRAQNFDLDKDRQPVASLDGLWRFHPGDDAHWADPTFDDSAWPLLRSDRDWSVQGYPGMSGYAWYRFTLHLPAGSPPVSLLLPPILTGYTLYVDGRNAGSAGNSGPQLFLRDPQSQSFHLTTGSAPMARTLHLALRVWHSPIWASYVGGGPSGFPSLAGDHSLLTEQQRDRVQNQAVRYIDLYVDAFLRAIIGVVILGLFLLRPREREYLWFACVQLFGGADDILGFFHYAYGFIPIPLFDLFDAALAAGFWIAGLFFFATVLNQRRGLWFRIALILAILSPLFVTLYWYGWVPVPVTSTLTVLFVLPSLVWVLSVLMVRSLRGDPEARLLLLPTLLLDGFYLAFNMVGDLSQLGWLPGAPDLLNYRFHFVSFDFGLYTIFNILFLVAMLAFLIRRFSLGRRQEERLLGEFEAARQVQHLLVPETAAGIPGFAIDSVYVPAESVGGDFFQQIPGEHGDLLIVIGDVAGKGLPAAMMVSMLVGAIRTEAAHTHDPAALLICLNERLLGRTQGGFVTCLAARLSSSGELVIANAGHIPPWRNGSALELPGSLPLGIVGNPEYRSETFTLAPGDRLTFLSDGVVEARSSSGELFGFERTGEISGQSAEEIAEAAKHFGQEDDITVLTLSFAPVEVLHA